MYFIIFIYYFEILQNILNYEFWTWSGTSEKQFIQFMQYKKEYCFKWSTIYHLYINLFSLQTDRTYVHWSCQLHFSFFTCNIPFCVKINSSTDILLLVMINFIRNFPVFNNGFIMFNCTESGSYWWTVRFIFLIGCLPVISDESLNTIDAPMSEEVRSDRIGGA